MSQLAVSNRSRVRRVPERASYDRKVIFDILDRGFICHVAITQETQVFVLPMAYVRLGENLYVHGSAGSRLMRLLAKGATTCAAITHIDGLVLARSAFHHSMNYRSVVVFGKPKVIPAAKKADVLDALMDHIAPGRKAMVRPPSDTELNQTMVIEIPIEEASAKVRTGPPKDDEADLSLDVWAGVLPLQLVPGNPVQDKDSEITTRQTPAYLLNYAGPFAVEGT